MAGIAAVLRILLLLDTSSVSAGLAMVKGQAMSAGTALNAGFAVGAVAAAAGLAMSAKAAAEWQDEMAGVERTIDMSGKTAQQQHDIMEGISNDLRDIATRMPLNHQDLAKSAQLAGSLGVPEDAIASFAMYSNIISRLSDDLTPEAATNFLGKIRTVTGLTNDEIDNLASTTVKLGVAGASTEGAILAMMSRASGALSTIDMSIDQQLAWAAAAANVGEASEAGGSSIQRLALLTQKYVAAGGGKQLQAIADAAGMTQEAFMDMWNEDTNKALSAYVNGLSEMEKGAAVLNLAQAGFGDVRITRFLTKIASAIREGTTGNLNETMALAAEGWSNETLAMDMFIKRSNTTAQKLDVLGNKIYDLGITIGNALLPFIDMFIDGLGSLVDGVNSFLKAFPAVNAVLGPFLAILAGIAALKFGSRLLGYLLPTGRMGSVLRAGWGGLLKTGIGQTIMGGLAKMSGGIKGALINLLRGAPMGVWYGAGDAAGEAMTRGLGSRLKDFLKSGLPNILKTVGLIALPIVLFAEVKIKADELATEIQKQQGEVQDKLKAFLDTKPTIAEVEAQITQIKTRSKGLVESVLEAFMPLGEMMIGKDMQTVDESNLAQLQAYIDEQKRILAGGARTTPNLFQKMASGIRNAVGNAVEAVGVGMGELKNKVSINFRELNDMLQQVAQFQIKVKPPKIQSFQERLKEMRKSMAQAWRQLKIAVKANDPVNIAYWSQRLTDVQGGINTLKEQGKIDVTNLATSLANSGVDIGGTFLDIKTDAQNTKAGVDTAMNNTETAVSTSVQAMESSVANASLYTEGQHLVQTAISGVNSQYQNAVSAGANIARAFRTNLAFSSPPPGPLHDIESWGPHMISRWTGGIRSALPQVSRTSDAAARAFHPQPHLRPSWGTPAGMRGTQPGLGRRAGRDVHYHIGTLIANDGGIDKLDRKIEDRKRMRKRRTNRDKTVY